MLVIKLEDGNIVVERPNDDPFTRSIHGTTRALIQNMVKGVSEGYRKTLQLVGVGYRVIANKGKGLEISLGYSYSCYNWWSRRNNIYSWKKYNYTCWRNWKSDLVGQVAADIRAKRAPEPTKEKELNTLTNKSEEKEGKSII